MSKSIDWNSWLGTLLLVAVVLLLVLPGLSRFNRQLPVPKGTPLPPLDVAGWLNTDVSGGVVNADTIRDRVVVIDFWASWCGPCQREMPKLARIYEQYAPLGVVFLGMTSEMEAELPNIEGFIKTVDGFDWPVGYGAMLPMDILGIRLIPTLVAFGPDGRAIWSGDNTRGLEDALDKQIAEIGLRNSE